MSYADEYLATLRRIQDENAGIRWLAYFTDTAARWHGRFAGDAKAPFPQVGGRRSRQVFVLGHGIPEELVFACGTRPEFLLGGSHASCAWSDEVVPRDSDPVSRSCLGYARQVASWPGIEPLFLMPMSNDNLRKMAYVLRREGHEVATVDVPPVGADVSSQRAWCRSLAEMVEVVCRHVHGRITAASIRRAMGVVAGARSAMIDFMGATHECPGVLGDEAALFVLSTYYQTFDLPRWSEMLRRLASEVRSGHPVADGRPRVLVFGSPILFPQHKVVSLINEAGLSLVEAACASSTARFASLTPEQCRGSVETLIEAIGLRHLTLDASGASVVGETMERYVCHLVQTTGPDGVICHVLKGQIEHDFELTRLEGLLDAFDIPLFRLETDYQEQDVEQLRIRLEAFAEMLGQRRYGQVRAVLPHLAPRRGAA